jgi:hypothetical protein
MLMWLLDGDIYKKFISIGRIDVIPGFESPFLSQVITQASCAKRENRMHSNIDQKITAS